MKRHLFDSQERYVKLQLHITKGKLRQGKTISWLTLAAAQALADYLKVHYPKPNFGLCHGVRLGKEVDELQELLGGEWIGTELAKECCDGKKILQWDFSFAKDEWLNHFDIIYSNSFDHARDPWETAKVWVSCLSQVGVLVVEWTAYSNKLGAGGNFADCLAATFDEYKEIFSTSGDVVDVLETSDKVGKRVRERKFLMIEKRR